MEWIDIFGYIASGLVFSTFCMKTMMPLRYLAIASNVGFIVYGILASIYPVLLLHVVLLPLNVARLIEIRKLVRNVRRSAKDDFSVDWLLPYMTKRYFRAGETLFHKSDAAHEMFYITNGTVRIVEIDKTIGPGHMLGEMGLFAPSQKRTATVEAVSDVQALSISDAKVIDLFHQEPSFAYFMTRLITARLIESAAGR